MIGNERMKKQRLINAIDNSQIYQIGDKWLTGREYEIVDWRNSRDCCFDATRIILDQ